MARGTYISEFERTVIRVGLAHEVPGPAIAHFLGRHKDTVYKVRDRMAEEGTLGDLPLPFVTAELVEAMHQRWAMARGKAHA